MPDRKTILIAEDDLTLLKALTVRLEAAGYKVVGVQDGYQALEKSRKVHPDVLLMDINMPAGTGLSVQERMRRNEETDSIPVVYMTGDTRESLMHQAETMGAVALLHKPIDTHTLLAVIESAIGSSSRSRNEAA